MCSVFGCFFFIDSLTNCEEVGDPLSFESQIRSMRVGRLDLRVVAYARLFGKCRSRPCVQNCTPLGILGNARVLGNCSSFSCIFVTMPRGQKQKQRPPSSHTAAQGFAC
ncbi:hypothetical protein PVAP13_8NG267706 [Panicum virgatum]|uniref:Uncharacterized protein n=1 Tax=Panicum virgatum TaxID=38727 RepID=A0A8T0PCT5_PANVG|nr:hypothetical protein PVAP13_8NG267706 [Panicum virgatum]